MEKTFSDKGSNNIHQYKEVKEKLCPFSFIYI